MSKEEAIKKLEKLASQKYDEKLLNSLHMITEEDETYILTIFERQAIETVLNYIKELEKGITRLKDKNKKLSEEIIDVKVNKVTRNFIPKQVIRELKEKIHNTLDVNGITRGYQLEIDNYFDELLKEDI